jgi:hypothetical protein
MIDVVAHGTWRIIGNIFYFWPSQEWEEVSNVSIYLAYHQWPAMRYGDSSVANIDFPWEYDVQGYGIECRRAWWLLHYVLTVHGKRIALVQDPAVVAEEDSGRVDVWYCTTQECMKAIEAMELEGECVVLSGNNE